jgi:hypothetical protein
MKRLLWPFALCSLLLPLSSLAGETVTVEGVLVDMQCYVLNKSKLSGEMAADRQVLATCSAESAKAGVPVAVWNGRVAGGELITVASPAYLLADHLAKPARLTGELNHGHALTLTKKRPGPAGSGRFLCALEIAPKAIPREGLTSCLSPERASSPSPSSPRTWSA